MLIGNIEIDRAEVMTEVDWLADRPNFIGSSDAAALFGLGYSFLPSVWSLWGDKTGKVPRDERDDDERMTWGQLLERPILEVVKRRTGWDVVFPIDGHSVNGVAVASRLRIRAPHGESQHEANTFLAATCDAFVVSHDEGLGLIEVKNRDFLSWRDEYTEESAAPRDQIQLAQQMICVPEASWGVIAVLVGGNDLKIYHYTRESLAQQMADIQERTLVISKQIATMEEPSVIDERELPAWARLHYDDKVVEVLEVAEEHRKAFDAACSTLLIDDAMSKDLAKNVKKAKAVITGIVGVVAVANSLEWTLKIKTSQRNEASITLGRDEIKTLLEIAGNTEDDHEQGLFANVIPDADRKRLVAVAGWQEVTRRQGLSRSFESTRKNPEAPKSDILEDIRNTKLGG